MISLKYFNIIPDNEKKGNFKIIYLYPIVEEIIVEIYNFIINKNPDIFKLLEKTKIDNGAKGGLFEKYVIFNMKGNKSNFKNIFYPYDIRAIEYIERFLPRENEKYYKKKELKYLEDGIYIFEQKIFGGKTFDVGIFIINQNSAKVYLFQISINKKIIYEINHLMVYINSFIEYFSYFYTMKIEKENVYFSYIFSLENKTELIENVKTKGSHCIFFDIYKSLFVNEKGKIINNINEIAFYPFKNNFHTFPKEKKIFKNLNSEEEKGIIEYLKIEKLFVNDKEYHLCYISESKNIFTSISSKYIYINKLRKNESDLLYKDGIIKDVTKENFNTWEHCSLFIYFKEERLHYMIINNKGEIFKLKYIPIYEDRIYVTYELY